MNSLCGRGRNSGKLVWGVGVKGVGKYVSTLEGHKTKEYRLWQSMLGRCYNEDFKSVQKSYNACTVSENFKNFQYFAEWCNRQIGFGKEGWDMDKDLLIRGNKLYSEDTCVFVPKRINTLMLNRKAGRGVHPLGVSFHKGVGWYTAKLSLNNHRVHLGCYESADAAFIAYKLAKESHIRDVAEFYKSVIDERVYISLINWKIGADD